MDRTTDIILRYSRGQTLRAIGDHWGITRERVRQILAKEGVTSRPRGTGSANRATLCVCSEMGCRETADGHSPRCAEHRASYHARYASNVCESCGWPSKGLMMRLGMRCCPGCYSWWWYYTSAKRRAQLHEASNLWRMRNPERAREIQKRATEKYLAKKRASVIESAVQATKGL